MEPKRTDAEVLYQDGQWRPATVLSWKRLDAAHRQPITKRWIFWLVHLQFGEHEEGWFEYDQLNLRPRHRLNVNS